MASKKYKEKGGFGFLKLILILAVIMYGGYYLLGGEEDGTGSGTDVADAMSSLETAQQEVESQYLDPYGKVSEDDVEDVLQEYYNKVSDIKGVSDCRLNDGCVAIDLADGSRYVYVPEVDGLDSGGDKLVIATYEPYQDDFRTEEEIKLQTEQNIYTPSLFEDAADIIGTNYYESLSWDNANYNDLVTIDSILEMQHNKIIFWNGHGCYDTKYHSIICTDIPWDSNVPKEYRDDLLILSGSSGKHVGIPAEFFENNMEDGALEGSIFYLGICYGITDDHLADALMDRGARTVLGFNGKVHHSYDANMAFDVLAAGMAEPDATVFSAVGNAQATNGQYDTGSCSGTKLVIRGDDMYTIGEMIDLYGPARQSSSSDPTGGTQYDGVLTEDDVLGYWTTDENDDQPEVVQVYKDGGMLKYRMFLVMPDTDGDHYIFEANDGEAELMSNLESLFCYGSDGSIYASFFCDNIDEDKMERQEYEQTWYRWNGFPYEDVVRDHYGY